MISFPGVKINIGLSVLNKRTDGYHNIQSIFYPVTSYNDCIEIIESDKFSFEKHGIVIAGNDNENLCYKAYELLKKDFSLPAVSIKLLKRIPTGAGLGGGSSNASSTLLLLNDLFKLNLSKQILSDYAAKLGSDCPFFILNQAAFINGRGEIIEPIKLDLKGYFLTIINPGFSISTKNAYENIKCNDHPIDIKAVSQLPIWLWKDLICNDFEQFAFSTHPDLLQIKQSLYKSGSLYVSMTGSGSSVYAISESQLNLPKQIKRFGFWQGLLD